MISWNNMKIQRLFLLIVCISCIFTIHAQVKCFYYALTKKVQKGISSTNVSGGQFITFFNEVCYESNKKGIGVGHGNLQLNKNYSDSDFKVYMGGSYWGNEATFKFKSDLSMLNVVLENGDVYVYRRQTPPSSATTCSLIRKKGSSTGSSDNGGAVYTPSYPNYGNNGGNTSNPTRDGNNTSTRRQPTKRTCSLCNGQRRIVKDTYPSLYGQSDYQVRCNECGGYFMRSTGHTHVTCPQCHGKGYFTTE